MNWALLIVLAYLGVSILINIGRVGKTYTKRPRDAVYGTIEWSILIALVIWAVNW